MRVFVGVGYVMLIILTALIIGASLRATQLRDQYQQALTPSGQTGLYGKAFLETVTFGLYDGASKDLDALKAHQAAAAQMNRVTMGAMIGFAVVTSLLIGLAIVGQYQQPPAQTWRALSAHVLAVTALLFVLGVSTPIMTIWVTKDIPVVGSILFQSTTKGILSTIASLFQSQNTAIALLLIIFSLGIPLLKLGLSSIVVFRQAAPPRLVAVLQAIGKWSMADVLVVAILVAFFSTVNQGSDQFTHAQVGIGLYCFAAYCLASMLASVMVGQAVRQPSGVLPHAP